MATNSSTAPAAVRSFDTGVAPTFSPSRALLAAVEMSESGFGSLNAFAVWRVEAAGVREIGRVEDLPSMSDWQIDSWTGENCVSLSAAAAWRRGSQQGAAHRYRRPAQRQWLERGQRGLPIRLNRSGTSRRSTGPAQRASGTTASRSRSAALAAMAPELVRPGHRWSRPEVLHWLIEEMQPETLVGLDLGISLAFADREAFFPGWSESPRDARRLWALVDRLCVDDQHLSVTSFVDHAEAARHFSPATAHARVTCSVAGGDGSASPKLAQQMMGCKPYSNFNLVGAAQVGKSSLRACVCCHRLAGVRLRSGPIDPLPESGSALIEIYTTIAAMAAGRRRRNRRSARFRKSTTRSPQSAAIRYGRRPIDDHRSDAILTAAMATHHCPSPGTVKPAALTPEIARTEGWTFGTK
jgi:hypothetical protein